jgi:uncharacterized membrane protein YeaQ/YmgE (transglycosylase-associated protein family)
MQLDPGGLIAWLIVGAIAGWLASVVVQGTDLGGIGDIVVGIVGAFIGGFVLNLFGVGGTFGLFGSILVAFVGAALLLALANALTPRRTVDL